MLSRSIALIQMVPRESEGDDAVWEDSEIVECLGERGDIIDVTKQTRMIKGQRQERWLASRGNEILIERSDGHFETQNGGEIIARFPS